MIYWYRFIGYPAYQNYRQEIKERISEATSDDDLHYYIAVCEAVCNAARYGIKGIFNTKISIKLKIENDALQTQIFSHTKPFNMLDYREKIRELASIEKIRQTEWNVRLEDCDRGRGFWLMLAACDFIVVEKSGNFVLLHTPLPFRNELVKNKIGQLVPRFFIDDRSLII